MPIGFASDGVGSMKVMTAAVANIIFATAPWIDPSWRLDLALAALAFFLLPDSYSSSTSEGTGVPCVATYPFCEGDLALPFFFFAFFWGSYVLVAAVPFLRITMGKDAVRSRTFAFLPIVTGARVPVVTFVPFGAFSIFIELA